ncbi:receptor tyrosine-protein kinase erbB-2-like [Panulirus ornatus]|uniref:receptor tyrosine-protein kinase erbB-2-like n=1 Tax=Panulirus ornatus TaxID=150431 RepID=UPI003A8C3BCD
MSYYEVLSRVQVERLLGKGKTLGEGAFGTTYLVRWNNSVTVLKVLKDFVSPEAFNLEAYFLEKVNGAGGAPRLLAVSHDPPALMTTFVGRRTLGSLLLDHHLPDSYLGIIALHICLQVKELHEIGVVHQDLHASNILVTVPKDLSFPPKVSIIDFGSAVYEESALALQPADDRYHNMKNYDGSSVASLSEDVTYVGELLQDIFDAMLEAAPEPARRLVQKASSGCMDSLNELIAGLREVLTD